MGRGLPDYWTLTRSTYGTVKQKSYSDFFLVSGTKTLWTVAGKGIIYGGSALVLTEPTNNNDRLTVIIDGTSVGVYSYDALYSRGLVYPQSAATFLCKYDRINGNYAVGIRPGITFETSLVLTYTSLRAGFTVLWGIEWAEA